MLTRIDEDGRKSPALGAPVFIGDTVLKDFNHQVREFNRFKDQEYGALFWDMGLGKTRVAIELSEHWYEDNIVDAVVVITMKSLINNWVNIELPIHATINYNTFAWGKDKEIPKSKKLLYFVINIDGILSIAFKDTFKEFMRRYPRFGLIIDESTVVKSGKAKRTRMAIKIAERAKRRFIMTGTPITNSPMDLYSQCMILRPGLLGYDSLVAFRNRYAITKIMKFGMRSFEQIVGYKNLGELTTTVQKFAAIMKIEEAIDIPPKRYRVLDVELTKEQKTAYEELKNKAVAWIQEHEITTANAVSLINRLMQICAGQLKVDQDKYISIVNNRLDVLSDLVDECDGKTIIWCSFVNSALDIMKTLGPRGVHLPSGLTMDEQQERLNQFKMGPQKALVANPASQGHGHTWVESSNVIYFSNSYNWGLRTQSEGRTYRAGQTKSVLYTDLIAKGTIEDRVLSVLKKKEEMADAVITSKTLLLAMLTNEKNLS